MRSVRMRSCCQVSSIYQSRLIRARHSFRVREYPTAHTRRVHVQRQDYYAGMLQDAHLMGPDFRYNRLNWARNEIRLIQVLPSKDGDDPTLPLRCTLRTVSLGRGHDYIALSYAWGDALKSKQIILNGRHFHITANLDTALRQVRRMQEREGMFKSRTFWVDAICINQKDDIEKGWQVSMMKRIYEQAACALVWLGPSTASSDKAIDIIRNLHDLVKSGAHPVNNLIPATFNLLAQQKDLTEALNDFLIRAWWRRIWVVQEFASAKDVIFLCGDQRLPWDSCVIALNELEQYKRALVEIGWKRSTGSLSYQASLDLVQTITGIRRLFRIRNVVRSRKDRLFLWELLTLKRFGMRATDNRDFVYALAGIADDASEKRLYPDYTKYVADIYTDIAKSFLAEGRLRTLWLCSHPRQLPNLPSWVPDLSTIWTTERRYFSSDAGYSTGKPIFAASGDSIAHVSFSSTGGGLVLHLDGHAYSTVQSTKSVYIWGHALKSKDTSGIQSLLTQRFHEFRDLERSHWGERYNIERVYRSLVTDIEPSWSPDLQYHYRRSNPSFRRDLDQILGRVDTLDEGPQSWSLTTAPLDLLHRHDGRRAFITEKGNLGLGPADMLPGDIVAVIFGSEVPLILRTVGDDRYQVVGEAFVDGIMDGEVMDPTREKETFDLV